MKKNKSRNSSYSKLKFFFTYSSAKKPQFTRTVDKGSILLATAGVSLR